MGKLRKLKQVLENLTLIKIYLKFSNKPKNYSHSRKTTPQMKGGVILNWVSN